MKRKIMRKILLASAIAVMMAAPAFAKNTMVVVNLSGNVKSGSGPATASTIIPVGTVTIIATGNHVDVYNPATHSLITAISGVVVPLGTITDMVFGPAAFLTVQGAGPFAVTIDYSTVPPTVGPAVNL
jgi:hypothetical protein